MYQFWVDLAAEVGIVPAGPPRNLTEDPSALHTRPWWMATGILDQCRNLVRRDASITGAKYDTYAVTGRNRTRTGSMPIAACRYWHGSKTLGHINRGLHKLLV